MELDFQPSPLYDSHMKELIGKLNKNSLFYLKLGLVFFWGLWFLLAFSTNVFDYLYHFNLLPTAWRFRSGNYQLLAGTISIYKTPIFILNTLYLLDMIIQGACALLFFKATYHFGRKKSRFRTTNLAFLVSIALWATFIIMEEFFIAYAFESVHIRLLIFELFTLIAIHQLPDASP